MATTKPERLKAQRVESQTVSPYKLAAALDIPVEKIFLLAEMGYLCKMNVSGPLPEPPNHRIVRFPIPETPIPVRIIDRASIALWLAGLDEGSSFPVFNKVIEIEIMRIARLPDPTVRTEQALRMYLRYRDAEEIMKAVSSIRAGDMAAQLIQGKSKQHKRKLEKLMGLEKGMLDK